MAKVIKKGYLSVIIKTAFILVIILHLFYPNNMYYWFFLILFAINLLYIEIRLIKNGRGLDLHFLTYTNFINVFLIIGNCCTFFYHEFHKDETYKHSINKPILSIINYFACLDLLRYLKIFAPLRNFLIVL